MGNLWIPGQKFRRGKTGFLSNKPVECREGLHIVGQWRCESGGGYHWIGVAAACPDGKSARLTRAQWMGLLGLLAQQGGVGALYECPPASDLRVMVGQRDSAADPTPLCDDEVSNKRLRRVSAERDEWRELAENMAESISESRDQKHSFARREAECIRMYSLKLNTYAKRCGATPVLPNPSSSPKKRGVSRPVASASFDAGGKAYAVV